MEYCLSVGLHNLFYDLAIVNSNHEIVLKHRCVYDLNKDISNNIFSAYKKYFSDFQIEYVGVGVSNNIEFKDNILYKMKLFNFNRYDLKQSLNKIFKKDVYILEETYLASLSVAFKLDSKSLLYLVLDNRISNSFVVSKEIVELEDDINLNKNIDLDRVCSKTFLRRALLNAGYDDDFISGCFFSINPKCLEITKNWANTLEKHIKKITRELKVDDIVFAGYLGDYFEEYKKYMNFKEDVTCHSLFHHRDETLIGVSHLIFKDN